MGSDLELVKEVDVALNELKIERLGFWKRLFTGNVVAVKDLAKLITKNKNDKESSKSRILFLEDAVTQANEKINTLTKERDQVAKDLLLANATVTSITSDLDMCSLEKTQLKLENDEAIAKVRNEYEVKIRNLSKEMGDKLLNMDDKAKKEIGKLQDEISNLKSELEKKKDEPASLRGVTSAVVHVDEMAFAEKKPRKRKKIETTYVKGKKSLTPENVREMRRLYDTKEMTSFTKLGSKFGISETGAARICKKETYKNVK